MAGTITGDLTVPLSWNNNLSDHVLLQIFRYLRAEVSKSVLYYKLKFLKSILIHFQDIMVAARVSKVWYRVSRDELMWKSLFKRDWNISPKIGMAPSKLYAYFCVCNRLNMLSVH
jgi:F-box/WD-40 domain protein 5